MSPSPPDSPAATKPRPMSAMVRPNRSSSRMSMGSKHGGSRFSDEDGKTAVKVAVRVRPPLRPADPGYDLVPQRFRGSTCQVSTSTNLTVESAQGRKLFVFDRVFGEEVDQEGVWEYLSESVNSFVQGYNVSILAYGQSGAGKSYTMGTTGPAEQNDAKVMALFEKLCGPSGRSGIKAPSRYSMSNGLSTNAAKSADKNWQLKASYVEIYQESLRDLLIDETVPMNERPQVAIREDPKGRILLTGLKQVPVNSVEDLLNALNFGSSIRQTDATAVNARSSRSHAVFSLNLIQKRSSAQTSVKEKRMSVPLEAMSGGESWVTIDSKLHFVDLAGSERLKNTGAQGERAKEGISINAGLASLGKVISQLSSRQPGTHVSYRDSKLTRLLQDSLGGNAITYMVACVNPAEFHLSETLNTVQYAQRARAIQSKPQIQQHSDDADKQAIIERLRAEISFLRDQIRLSERTDRKATAPQERSERLHERDIELQNQLLDIQENYNALSQRHAKLISEITKARDNVSEDTPILRDTVGNTALERLKRSNSFAEAVEQVVLEYEKTIQTLEASLSNTRSSLSVTESTLLEKETKIAYMETVTHQLQSRLQKAMDREMNDENYLRDLETRVAGATTGEEKSSAMIQGLRKELTRARENEASCEEYISTLEERLAEAEQDHEMMQREIERLEHVVERQRSINKLDNLLHELDGVRQVEMEPYTNGHAKHDSDSYHSVASEAKDVHDDASSAYTSPRHSGPVATVDTLQPILEASPAQDKDLETHTPANIATSGLHVEDDHEPTSPAQSRFVADKLETVTHELFELRMEHDATVTDYDELQRKYQVALQTLAELQDTVEQARRGSRILDDSRPTSFLAEEAIASVQVNGGKPSYSRTLSSELSSLGESPNSILDTAAEEAETEAPELAELAALPHADLLSQEMEKLKKLAAEKEERIAELSENYAELQEQHRDTLDYVEELKAEVQKAQMSGRASPSPSVLRRKSSQMLASADNRAARSFASLRNFVVEHFEGDPDKIQSFDVNLNAAMNELNMRTERVTALEAEVASMRKEMESKMTIISGLTRERTSLKVSSPLDITAISSMHDQLLESENKIRVLSEAHASRERELLEQIDSLKASLSTSTTPMLEKSIPGHFPETPASESGTKALGEVVPAVEHQRQLDQLQKEVADWRSKHDSAIETMKTSEQHLLEQINGLESALKTAEEQSNTSRSTSPEDRAVEIFAPEKKRYEESIQTLQQEIGEHKSTAAARAERLAELEQSYNKILAQVEEDQQQHELTEQELLTHRQLVSNLERQIDEHKNAVQTHQQALDALKESHVEEIAQLNEALKAAESDSDKKLTALIAEHQEETAALQKQLEQVQAASMEATSAFNAQVAKVQGELTELIETAGMVLNKPTTAANLTAHIQTLVNARKDIGALHETATNELQSVRQELEDSRARTADFERKMAELKSINDEMMKELEVLGEKEKKSSRLVEELEDQLNSNYDQTQAANNRLSALQTERQVQLEEVVGQLEDARARIATLETQLTEAKRRSHRESLDPRDANGDLQRSNSGNSNNNLRKSVSAASLPSPPPAIPLPPLPGPNAAANAASPPASRHQSKDMVASQLAEDQEARLRTIEKHLFAEKQLTATLEEALTDLEASSTKLKSDMEGWRRKCAQLEEEVQQMKKERQSSRLSVQQLEEERNARKRIEAQRQELEQRMAQLSKQKKKKSSINCF
ncbi:kinesin-domain-containing protein [Trichodelitschia bisporula]|uniref:Kinesin-domain-containing protein n=1 Tax=Trichodelitschia bisporula TaxID=703511 RepID=A0A6G1I094_9PEZI|nr:kinesin-domain-containing protein [Trichodelitschia bisporula]